MLLLNGCINFLPAIINGDILTTIIILKVFSIRMDYSVLRWVHSRISTGTNAPLKKKLMLVITLDRNPCILPVRPSSRHVMVRADLAPSRVWERFTLEDFIRRRL